MKLYVGSRDYKPEGYLSVDIDPTWKPDIVGDITDLHDIADGSVEEIVASHVLEHLPWPHSFKAMAEFCRVLSPHGSLKIAVPDLGLLAELISSGKSTWHAAGLIFGVGRIHNRFEAHQYGFTIHMLTELLSILGFRDFTHWNSDFPDASNGWLPLEGTNRMAISLNVQAIKREEPSVPPLELYELFMAAPLAPLEEHLRSLIGAGAGIDFRNDSSRGPVQSMHFQLIDAQQKVKLLEELVESQKKVLDWLSSTRPS